VVYVYIDRARLGLASIFTSSPHARPPVVPGPAQNQ
jgi:hypothetical protein